MFLNIKRLFQDVRCIILKKHCNYFEKNLLDRFSSKGESYNSRLQKKYSRVYEDYWNPANRAKRFHVFNNIRTHFIYQTFHRDEKLNRVSPKEKFFDVKMLVIGCSGGILTESMAELNFEVTGIDPDPYFIVIAKHHQERNKLLVGKKLNYVKATVEEFCKTNSEKFDAVVISNVLEYDINFWHKKNFLKSCVQCCKPNGNILVTTMDSSFATFLWSMHFDTEPFWNAVNHKWYRGTNPVALYKLFSNLNCRVMEKRGIDFLPMEPKFVPATSIKTWYFVHAMKNDSSGNT